MVSIRIDTKDNCKLAKRLRNPSQTNGLIDFWVSWLSDNNLTDISADDLLHSHHMDKDGKKLNAYQLKVVNTYSKFWDLIN